MEYRMYGGTYYVRMDRGDEVFSGIIDLCRAEGLQAAMFNGIAGCGAAEIQTFIPEKGAFDTRRIEGLLEVVSMNGNVILGEDGAYCHHTHALLAYVDGGKHAVAGGHMKSLTVSYTAEIELRPVVGGAIRHKLNPETGTGFWDFGD